MKRNLFSSVAVFLSLVVLFEAVLFSDFVSAQESVSDLILSVNGEDLLSGPFSPELVKTREAFLFKKDQYQLSFELGATEPVTVSQVYIHTNTSSTDDLIQMLLGFSETSLSEGKTHRETITFSSSEAHQLPPTALLVRFDFCSANRPRDCSRLKRTIHLRSPSQLRGGREGLEDVVERDIPQKGTYQYSDLSKVQNRTALRTLSLQEMVGFDFMHLLNDTERERLREILQSNESDYVSFLEEHFTIIPVERKSADISGNISESIIDELRALNSSSVTQALEDYQKTADSTVQKEVVVYRMKNKQSSKSDFVSKIILSYTAEEDTNEFTIIEQIPKEIAAQASLLEFNLPPEVLEEDPIVKWSFNDVPKGGRVDISYSVPSRVNPVETRTIIYGSDTELITVRGILFIGVLSVSLIVGSMVWSRKYADRRPQNITIRTGRPHRKPVGPSYKNRNL